MLFCFAFHLDVEMKLLTQIWVTLGLMGLKLPGIMRLSKICLPESLIRGNSPILAATTGRFGVEKMRGNRFSLRPKGDRK
jgi:hypothetical protein